MNPRVAVIGKSNHLFWGEHVRDAFLALGWDARFFPVNKRTPWVNVRRALAKIAMPPRAAQLANDKFAAAKMAEEMRRFAPDAVFFAGCFFVSRPFYEMACGLQPRPKIIGWDGDSHARSKGAKEFAPFLDVLFSSDRSVIAEHGDCYKRTEYLTFAAEPAVHRDCEMQREQSLYFCGARTPKRERFLSTLGGLPLTVRGKGWGRAAREFRKAANVRAGMLRPEEWVKDFNRHAVVVNIHQDEHGSESPLNMRVFEAPACGALLLCDERDELPEVFSPGEEILTFGSPEELAEKARWALSNPAQAGKMAACGKRRTLAEHTYRHRLAVAAEIIKGI